MWYFVDAADPFESPVVWGVGEPPPSIPFRGPVFKCWDPKGPEHCDCAPGEHPRVGTLEMGPDGPQLFLY